MKDRDVVKSEEGEEVMDSGPDGKSKGFGFDSFEPPCLPVPPEEDWDEDTAALCACHQRGPERQVLALQAGRVRQDQLQRVRRGDP